MVKSDFSKNVMLSFAVFFFVNYVLCTVSFCVATLIMYLCIVALSFYYCEQNSHNYRIHYFFQGFD